MIEIDKAVVMNFEGAIRGARNPMASWNRIDSYYDDDGKYVLYWWKEFDTYKVATVANSTSTMHKIHSRPFEMSDFSCDKLTDGGVKALESLLEYLEDCRIKFVETKDKAYWYDIIQLLPESYNQTRTITMNYENLLNMYYARRNHKLAEWHTYCDWILTLPYTKELFLQ